MVFEGNKLTEKIDCKYIIYQINYYLHNTDHKYITESLEMVSAKLIYNKLIVSILELNNIKLEMAVNITPYEYPMKPNLV